MHYFQRYIRVQRCWEHASGYGGTWKCRLVRIFGYVKSVLDPFKIWSVATVTKIFWSYTCEAIDTARCTSVGNWCFLKRCGTRSNMLAKKKKNEEKEGSNDPEEMGTIDFQITAQMPQVIRFSLFLTQTKKIFYLWPFNERTCLACWIKSRGSIALVKPFAVTNTWNYWIQPRVRNTAGMAKFVPSCGLSKHVECRGPLHESEKKKKKHGPLLVSLASHDRRPAVWLRHKWHDSVSALLCLSLFSSGHL